MKYNPFRVDLDEVSPIPGCATCGRDPGLSPGTPLGYGVVVDLQLSGLAAKQSFEDMRSQAGSLGTRFQPNQRILNTTRPPQSGPSAKPPDPATPPALQLVMLFMFLNTLSGRVLVRSVRVDEHKDSIPLVK